MSCENYKWTEDKCEKVQCNEGFIAIQGSDGAYTCEPSCFGDKVSSSH